MLMLVCHVTKYKVTRLDMHSNKASPQPANDTPHTHTHTALLFVVVYRGKKSSCIKMVMYNFFCTFIMYWSLFDAAILLSHFCFFMLIFFVSLTFHVNHRWPTGLATYCIFLNKCPHSNKSSPPLPK